MNTMIRHSLLAASVLTCLWTPSYADAAAGNLVPDQLKGPALVDHDTTMVPLREIGDWLGLVVKWAPPHITLSKDEVMVELSLGSRSAAYTDGAASRQLTLAAPPRAINGTVYVPLRFVAEALGAVIHNYPAEGLVSLSMGESFATLPVGMGSAPPRRRLIRRGFEAAKSDGTAPSFKKFLATWPDSSLAAEANKLLNECQAKDRKVAADKVAADEARVDALANKTVPQIREQHLNPQMDGGGHVPVWSDRTVFTFQTDPPLLLRH